MRCFQSNTGLESCGLAPHVSHVLRAGMQIAKRQIESYTPCVRRKTNRFPPQRGWRPIKKQKYSQSGMQTFLLAAFCFFCKACSFRDHSHSIVAIGFGLISKQTRHTPSTSLKIRSVIFFRIAQSISGTVHTIASTVFTARMITGQ